MLLYITYQREANPSSLYTNLNACHIPEYLPLEIPCKRQRKKSCSLEDNLRITVKIQFLNLPVLQ